MSLLQKIFPKKDKQESFGELLEKKNPGDGISIYNLNKDDKLVVYTLYSRYEISILNPKNRKIAIQGGIAFQKSTKAYLEGSAFSLLSKALVVGFIGKGLDLEVYSRRTGRVVAEQIKNFEVYKNPENKEKK